jgi:hypothetical protein
LKKDSRDKGLLDNTDDDAGIIWLRRTPQYFVIQRSQKAISRCRNGFFSFNVSQNI